MRGCDLRRSVPPDAIGQCRWREGIRAAVEIQIRRQCICWRHPVPGLCRVKQFAQIEGEVGVGHQFEILHETEVWAALYFRWKWFPWNEFITTTLAVSTGVNYASGLPQYEVDMSGVGYGSRLLHYFSPEITFALPSRPDWQFLTRVHHRSGGEHYWGYTPLFKGVDGGTQYLVFGIRHWF